VLRTTITVAREDVEEALDLLLPLLPAGVFQTPLGELTEIAWHGDPPLQDPRPALGALLRSWEECELPDDPQAWRRLLGRGWTVGDRIHVRAPEDESAPDGLEEIVVDAASGAFGGGGHPTTRHCLELMLGLEEPGGSFADLGCGAGILAVFAARLGYAPVIAVDVEARSVESTRANARRNGVEVAVAVVDLIEQPPPPAATIAANVPLQIHQVLAERLVASTVLVSGISRDGAADALEAYRAQGYDERRRVESHGWTTLLVSR